MENAGEFDKAGGSCHCETDREDGILSWGEMMMVAGTNKRKAKCADCKRLLQAGEGIAHRYPMFHGKGEFYYLCSGCDRKREAETK